MKDEYKNLIRKIDEIHKRRRKLNRMEEEIVNLVFFIFFLHFFNISFTCPFIFLCCDLSPGLSFGVNLKKSCFSLVSKTFFYSTIFFEGGKKNKVSADYSGRFRHVFPLF